MDDPEPPVPAGSDARGRARGIVSAYDPPDDAQRVLRRRILAFIDRHPDALLRTCEPGHLTGSAFVVDHTRTRTALLLHAKLGRWLQPGGHADGDGDLARVALREATEETGISGLVVVGGPVDLDVHRVAPPDDPPHDHLDVRFVLEAPRGASLQANHESRDLRWIPIADLAMVSDEPGLLRLAVASRRRLAER